MNSSDFQAGAVVYAKDLDRLTRFYAEVVDLEIVHRVDDHVVLESDCFELVIVAIPAATAGRIAISSPPERREATAFKLVFPVPDIAAARTAAAASGGVVDPAVKEWSFQGLRVCDGMDPEGNVIQLRETGSTSKVVQEKFAQRLRLGELATPCVGWLLGRAFEGWRIGPPKSCLSLAACGRHRAATRSAFSRPRPATSILRWPAYVAVRQDPVPLQNGSSCGRTLRVRVAGNTEKALRPLRFVEQPFGTKPRTGPSDCLRPASVSTPGGSNRRQPL